MRVATLLVAGVLVASGGASSLRKLRRAQELLNVAFAREAVAPEPLQLGMALLQEISALTSQVFRAGGRMDLPPEDAETVQAYLDEKVFVLGDVLPLVLQEEPSAERMPPLHRWRLVATLRMSWWAALVPNASLWPLPFFGALAAVSRTLHRTVAMAASPYAAALWDGSASAEMHLEVLSQPLASWQLSRAAAFERACACLALADGRVMVEAAERHFKSMEHSLDLLLEQAAVWPLFSFLRSLAARRFPAGELEQTEPEEQEEVELESAAGPSRADVQHLGPAEALELYRMLHVVARVLDALEVQWWASHGTLLGALRDGGLSLHADDCEIDVSEADVEALQSLRTRRALARNGYELSYDPRGRCFKVWPAGSQRARASEEQLRDQSWWLPQQRVGSPSLDLYIVEAHADRGDSRFYISNEEFHCNSKVCSQRWLVRELASFVEVPFGQSHVRVPVGAAEYLSRVYGSDWNTTVRPHRWASEQGYGFEPLDVAKLATRAAGPTGPLPTALLP